MTPVEIERLFRDEAGRVLATLIRLVGDFDLAEDALQDAFAVALERWSAFDVPSNPRAWLVNVGRNKAIDRIRRERALAARAGAIAHGTERAAGAPEIEEEPFTDDLLRLVADHQEQLAPELRAAWLGAGQHVLHRDVRGDERVLAVVETAARNNAVGDVHLAQRDRVAAGRLDHGRRVDRDPRHRRARQPVDLDRARGVVDAADDARHLVEGAGIGRRGRCCARLRRRYRGRLRRRIGRRRRRDGGGGWRTLRTAAAAPGGDGERHGSEEREGAHGAKVPDRRVRSE